MGASGDCHSFVVHRWSDAVIEIGLEWPCECNPIAERSAQHTACLHAHKERRPKGSETEHKG